MCMYSWGGGGGSLIRTAGANEYEGIREGCPSDVMGETVAVLALKVK